MVMPATPPTLSRPIWVITKLLTLATRSTAVSTNSASGRWLWQIVDPRRQPWSAEKNDFKVFKTRKVASRQPQILDLFERLAAPYLITPGFE